MVTGSLICSIVSSLVRFGILKDIVVSFISYCTSGFYRLTSYHISEWMTEGDAPVSNSVDMTTFANKSESPSNYNTSLFVFCSLASSCCLPQAWNTSKPYYHRQSLANWLRRALPQAAARLHSCAGYIYNLPLCNPLSFLLEVSSVSSGPFFVSYLFSVGFLDVLQALRTDFSLLETVVLEPVAPYSQLF